MKKNITLFLLIGGMLIVPVQSMATGGTDPGSSKLRDKPKYNVRKVLNNRGSKPITDPREAKKEAEKDGKETAIVEQGSSWKTLAKDAAYQTTCCFVGAGLAIFLVMKIMAEKD